MPLESMIYCLAAFGLAALSAKYGLSKAPIDYHRAILVEGNVPLKDNLVLILTALYRVWAGAMLALAICIAALALGPVVQGAFWANLTVLTAAGVAGLAGVVVPRRVETATGVRTPWRLAAGLLATVVLGFALSLI